jgi:hypothetical protein
MASMMLKELRRPGLFAAAGAENAGIAPGFNWGVGGPTAAANELLRIEPKYKLPATLGFDLHSF